MKNCLILILIFSISCNYKTEEINNQDTEKLEVERPNSINTEGIDKCWEGTLNEKTPIFIHYQIKDKLLIGEIIYLNTKSKTPIQIIGTIEDEGEYRLLEFDKKGNITGVIVVKPTDNEFSGSWFSPISRKELKLTLTKKDTIIQSVDYEEKFENIFGDYHYAYGEKGSQGDFNIEKIENNLVAFNIFSVTSDPSRNIADIELDTITLNKTNFIYQVPESDSCEFEVKFYKNFVYIRYTRGYCAGQFGNNATIDGIFYKTVNQKIDIKE